MLRPYGVGGQPRVGGGTLAGRTASHDDSQGSILGCVRGENSAPYVVEGNERAAHAGWAGHTTRQFAPSLLVSRRAHARARRGARAGGHPARGKPGALSYGIGQAG